jgi:hypothetical protein
VCTISDGNVVYLFFLCIARNKCCRVIRLLIYLFSLTGPECGVHSTRAFTYVVGHLIDDPTRGLEPVVIEGISTSGPRCIF